MVTRIKLMNEHSVAWPLWTDWGQVGEGDLPLSRQLADRLKAWAAVFDEHFHWEHGWDGYADPAGHAREGLLLQRALQDELGADYEVTLRLWETGAPPSGAP
ncbi:hypothetical protein [Cellulomonas carbonis]|uniref:Uncharacterized protein n=1 Tax=Cellulomonas carbonis T26 TaxID=947969 RepID=A0A0A0BLU5_9CELL|nr:hypothetical protein [Cellulomonas carbonis]KGM08830.1 hypothetical protein N868_05980 [Cellulomonas carbonis T26]GGC18390.1 hypothetical protein GCM10010972_34540 [Cellulomonas carbonis]